MLQVTWLVTGAAGMLGTDLGRLLDEREIAWQGLDRGDLDLLDPRAVEQVVGGHEVVVNCAAWTAVDDAETHESEAFEVNAVAAAHVARAARRTGAWVVHLSTDYVFAGDATRPYPEDAAPAPRSAYGRTKLAGEWAVRAEAPERHHVVRTAWLYGAHGTCFPTTIVRLARERGSLRVVDDQVGQPTWTHDLADLILRLVQTGAPAGTWHATSSGEVSWCDFAREVVAAAGMSPELVTATDSASFPRPAPRPAYSVLGHDRLRVHGLDPIGDWRARWRCASSEVLGPVLDAP